MEKYGTDIVAETKAAIEELERRANELSKTANASDSAEVRARLQVAKDRLKELETTTV
jgi:hypothetical protein